MGQRGRCQYRWRVTADSETLAGGPSLTGSRQRSWNWVGLVPFFLFSTAFLLGPAIILFYRSFQDAEGGLSLANYGGLLDDQVVESYWLSVRISLFTAILGGVFGFLLAWSVIYGGLPKFFRSLLTTFSGVASNFAGVPLAAAFIFTLGRIGIVTAFFAFLGFDLYDNDFTLYNFWGLSVVYMFFQFPLMVLTITPALEGLKKEWKEASENLGASGWQYWRHVALPGADAFDPGHDHPPLRQRLWRPRHRLCTHRRQPAPGHDPDRQPDLRRRAQQSRDWVTPSPWGWWRSWGFRSSSTPLLQRRSEKWLA